MYGWGKLYLWRDIKWGKQTFAVTADSGKSHVRVVQALYRWGYAVSKGGKMRRIGAGPTWLDGRLSEAGAAR